MTQSWVSNKRAKGLIISVMIKVSSFRVSVFSFMPELSVRGINFEFERSLACLVFCLKGPNWGNVIVLKR